jgi:hypothetical protein
VHYVATIPNALLEHVTNPNHPVALVGPKDQISFFLDNPFVLA